MNHSCRLLLVLFIVTMYFRVSNDHFSGWFVYLFLCAVQVRWLEMRNAV